MALIYTSSNKINFNDISTRYEVPKAYRAKLGNIHSDLIIYVNTHFRNTIKYKQRVVDALNLLTYCVLNNEVPPFDWTIDNPLGSVPSEYDRDEVLRALGDFALSVDSIEWDLAESGYDIAMEPYPEHKEEKAVPKISKPATKPAEPVVTPSSSLRSINPEAPSTKKLTIDTPKEDLYLAPPTYPRFDATKPWLSMEYEGEQFAIYTTLPEIPTRQREISVTTDVNRMTDSELLALFPTRTIETRPAVMYEGIPGFDYQDEEDLGIIYPIHGFTREEVIDNIIRYPHLHKKLKRRNEKGELRPIWVDVEIDGKLVPIDDVWEQLPDSKLVPRHRDIVREYMTRKYLLERDHGIQHKYPMYGTLEEFLTLFMPASFYIERGYEDVVGIARQCVKSRVSFLQSRNPMLRRLHLYE